MIETVAIIGAGTMGRGIAQVSALAGYQVILYDIAEALLSSALAEIQASIDEGVARGKTAEATATDAKAAFRLTTSLEQTATADLIIEVAPEQLDLKRDIFTTLDAQQIDGGTARFSQPMTRCW